MDPKLSLTDKTKEDKEYCVPKVTKFIYNYQCCQKWLDIRGVAGISHHRLSSSTRCEEKRLDTPPSMCSLPWIEMKWSLSWLIKLDRSGYIFTNAQTQVECWYLSRCITEISRPLDIGICSSIHTCKRN